MKKFRSIDEYTKEELYHELQRERAISECLRQEISDIKDIIRMQSNTHGNGNAIVTVESIYAQKSRKRYITFRGTRTKREQSLRKPNMTNIPIL